jgi:topoisomerase-4 subunit A
VLDAEEFIGEKSFKAKGKRLSNFEVESIVELEPREVEEEEDVAMPVVDGQDETPDDEPVKSQRDIFDDLTGQRRLFDEE